MLYSKTRIGVPFALSNISSLAYMYPPYLSAFCSIGGIMTVARKDIEAITAYSDAVSIGSPADVIVVRP